MKPARWEAAADVLIEQLSRARGLFLICALLVVQQLLGGFGADPDLFARLAAGKIVSDFGSVSLTDPFAFTPKKSVWIDHEWLAGVVFYELWSVGGDALLILFKFSAVLLTILFLLSAQSLNSAQPRRFGEVFFTVLLVLDCTYLWASTVRAQIFTYLFLAFFQWGFACARRSRGVLPVALQPVVMVPWCNMHGGFVVGLILQGIFAATRVFTRRSHWMVGLLIISVCATLVNPYGVAYWEYMWEALSMPRPSITEWNAMLPITPANLISYLLLAAYLIGLTRVGVRDRFAVAEIMLMAFFAVRHERMSALLSFSLIVHGTPAMGASFLLLRESVRRLAPAVSRVAAIMLLVGGIRAIGGILAFVSVLPRFQLDYSFYPVRALEWLSRHERGGDVLIDFNRGSYALWILYPRFRISVDGRYEEVYPESTVRMVSEALDCGNVRQLDALSEVDPDYIVAPLSAECFVNSPQLKSEWAAIYRDLQFAVYAPDHARTP